MISIVIPAFNEEGAIAKTVTQLRGTLETSGLSDIEIVVVDDGSTDRTSAEATAAGATVLRHPHNVGYGLSVSLR